MTKRLAVGMLLALALSAPALAGDIGAQKRSVDTKIAALHGRLSAQQQREANLRNAIDGVTARIRGLEARVGDVSLRLTTLEQDLSLHRERLTKLNDLYQEQATRLADLKRQYHIAVLRLNARLVAIYEADTPTTLEVVLGSASIQDALEQVHYATLIGKADEQVAAAVARSKRSMQRELERTRELRRTIQGETRSIAARAVQETEARDALVGARNSLASSKQQQLVALSDLSSQERAEAGEIDALQQASASLGVQIREAQQRSAVSSTPSTPSSAGLIWPVSGPITSPFGWRWGRMHEGIDIGVSSGTPIGAAAAGKVIYCGWEEGYGNLVVIDHGGNLATAYGHQSAIAVTCGEEVSQGQTIGYVGCTGHCTGPHLHFEVRINGNPVDPLGYL